MRPQRTLSATAARIRSMASTTPSTNASLTIRAPTSRRIRIEHSKMVTSPNEFFDWTNDQRRLSQPLKHARRKGHLPCKGMKSYTNYIVCRRKIC